jgi:hypothetical protein
MNLTPFSWYNSSYFWASEGVKSLCIRWFSGKMIYIKEPKRN